MLFIKIIYNGLNVEAYLCRQIEYISYEENSGKVIILCK